MKRRHGKKHRGSVRSSPVLVAYAWYKKEQWDRLREVCPDSKDFDERFEDWLAFANPRFKQLEREVEGRGMKLVKSVVDVDELLAWCRKNHLQPNGQARSQFAVEKAMEADEGMSG